MPPEVEAQSLTHWTAREVPNLINSFFFLIYLFNLFIFGCIGSSLQRAGATLLRCGAQASHCGGFSLWSTGSRRAGSVVAAHGLSCSVACGIFPDQGSNPCPLQIGRAHV